MKSATANIKEGNGEKAKPEEAIKLLYAYWNEAGRLVERPEAAAAD